MAASKNGILCVLILTLLFSGSLAQKYDNRNRENIANSYKKSSYKTEKKKNNYLYDSRNTYVANPTDAKDVERGHTNSGDPDDHRAGGNSLGRKYDNRNEENIGNSYEDSNYCRENNNNYYGYDSENRYVVDPTAAKDVRRGSTNFGHQNSQPIGRTSSISSLLQLPYMFAGLVVWVCFSSAMPARTAIAALGKATNFKIGRHVIVKQIQ